MKLSPTLWPLCALIPALVGCATGAPVGARSDWSELGATRFSPAAHPRGVPAESSIDATPVPAMHGDRDLAVALARGLVGKAHVEFNGNTFADDCTGLVVGVYQQLGLDLRTEAESGDNGVTAIYRFAQRHGRVYFGGWPVAGDIVFFRDTYDQNHDGRVNDGLTHVGLVDEVHPDGTIAVIHRVRRGVVRYRMNLLHRDVRADPSNGSRWNDYLRIPGPGHTEVLTGQLFAAYATVLPNAPVAER